MCKMKTTNLILIITVLTVLIGWSNTSSGQTFCNPNGNVIIYSNYNGGVLRINIDQNIPNINIGIVSYDDDSVIISGAYAANVTKVIYAGHSNSSYKQCDPEIKVKGIYGVSPSIVSFYYSPTATLNNINGHPIIICNYGCINDVRQGGCNTPDQIVDYFNTAFGTGNSSVYFHRTQYGCWTTTDPLKIYKISEGGNCCILSSRISTSLENMSIEENTLILPNPSDGHVRLTGNLQYQYLNVYNTTGTILFSKKRSEKDSSEIDISTLPQGVYFMELVDDSNSYNIKIVIQ